MWIAEARPCANPTSGKPSAVIWLYSSLSAIPAVSLLIIRRYESGMSSVNVKMNRELVFSDHEGRSGDRKLNDDDVVDLYRDSIEVNASTQMMLDDLGMSGSPTSEFRVMGNLKNKFNVTIDY